MLSLLGIKGLLYGGLGLAVVALLGFGYYEWQAKNTQIHLLIAANAGLKADVVQVAGINATQEATIKADTAQALADQAALQVFNDAQVSQGKAQGANLATLAAAPEASTPVNALLWSVIQEQK